MAAHLITGTAGLDVKSATAVARNVLTAVASVRLWSERPDATAPDTSSSALGMPPRTQDDVTRMVSIVGAVRMNSEVLPRSLREFLG